MTRSAKRFSVILLILCIMSLSLVGCGNQKAMSEQISGIMEKHGITEYTVTEVESTKLTIECSSFENLGNKAKRDLMAGILDDDAVRDICGSGDYYPDLRIYTSKNIYYIYEVYRFNSDGPFGVLKYSPGKHESVYDDGGLPWDFY